MKDTLVDLVPRLDQRGRASVDYIGILGKANNKLRESFADIARKAGLDEQSLANDLDARAEQLASVMAANPIFQTQQLLGEYHARNHGPIATEAFERVQNTLNLDVVGDCQLHIDEGFVPPAYWTGVDYHRTKGGWDADQHTGYIHAEIVHRKMVERIFPGGIFRSRLATAQKAPRSHYDRILDMGCSTGHYTLALAKAFPGAQITGIDPSYRALEHCARAGNAAGASWQLYQGAAETSGFADAQFDLVTSYILLHEVPADIVGGIFAEAFRLLAPGGDLLMADVTRFADMDKFAVWRQDLIARMGGEPYWRETAQLDFAAIARGVGFVDVQAEGIFPHIVKGRKPHG